MTTEDRRKAIIQANLKLKPLGLRICPTCEQLYPLIDEHYRSYIRQSGPQAGTLWRSSDCVTCEREADAKANRERWANDPDWRARQEALTRQWKAEHREQVNAQVRNYKQRQKREKFKAVLPVG